MTNTIRNEMEIFSAVISPVAGKVGSQVAIDGSPRVPLVFAEQLFIDVLSRLFIAIHATE